MAKLSEPEIQVQMPAAKGWDRLGDMLIRTWRFHSSQRALEFVNQVAGLADKIGHYPDIILSFRTVRVELSTHEDGGLTARDFELATGMNALPTER